MVIKGDIKLKKEFIFSILVGFIFSSGLWIIEDVIFIISKFNNPEIWFYTPLKIWMIYILIGITLALFGWLISFIVFKKRKLALENFKGVFSLIYIPSFLTIYLLAFYLLKVAHLLLPGFFHYINILLILTFSILVGVAISRFYDRIVKLLKISAIFIIFSFPVLILFPKIFNINAKIFPEVPNEYSRATHSKPNLLLIAVDALRTDHLSCLGYKKIETPNIDKIAQEGIIFSNCIAQAPWTLPSFGSMFTSKYPSQHGAERQRIRKSGSSEEKIEIKDGFLYEENITLAEILKEYAYYTASFQPNISAGSPFGFNQGVNFYFDCYKYKNLILEDAIGYITKRKINGLLYPSYKYAGDEKIANYIKKWLKINHDKQFFISTLLFDCHEYHLKEKGKKDEYHIPSEDLYNDAIKKADDIIGKIYNYLKKIHILDQTIIVLLSDHGEEFSDHGGYDRGYDYDYDIGKFHAHTLYDELIKIPLIIRYPKKIHKNTRVSQQVRSIDILPTILSLLDISYKGQFEGVDLSKNNFCPEENLRAYSESILEGPEKKSIRTNNWKLIYHPASQKFELYNLYHDPKEKINLANKEKEIFQSLKKELFSWIEKMPKQNLDVQKKRKLSAEEIDALKSLGYIK